ncbi:MAG: cytochrome P450 [Pseudomonadales bacterium]|nr:cytochrome P450 [Pseudomonadales bacterium]MCP5186059.1 cytochrome P450 [Pseudomonadales bacterium]
MRDENSPPEAPTRILEISAFDPQARENPHPRMRALREAGRVLRDETVKAWLLSHHDDIRATVNDGTFVRHPSKAEEGSITRMLADPDDPEGGRTSILFMDNPDHSRNRGPLMQAFYQRIKKMEAEIVALIDGVIDAAPSSGRFDLMAHIAIPIPILVIAHILGVDESRLGEFREWSEGLILGLNPMRTAEQTAYMEASRDKLDDYFTELMAARRQHPRNDLISDMVQAQAAGGDFADEELRINLQALLVGGNLTTTDLIGNGVWLFLTHPEQLAAFKADPKLDAPAVEEVLRYEAPVQATSRILSEDREVAGCPMHKSQPVFMSLAAANRDPTRFENAEAFDITVKRRSHISFGGGAHICIGAPLARIEARRVYRKLFERYPNMTLPEQKIVWRALPFFRGIEKLEVAV